MRKKLLEKTNVLEGPGMSSTRARDSLLSPRWEHQLQMEWPFIDAVTVCGDAKWGGRVAQVSRPVPVMMALKLWLLGEGVRLVSQ